MATGERPFRGGTNLSVLSSILKDTPRSVSELRDDIPRPLARMIERALEKRPEDRYQSATDLRRDLEDLKRDVDTGDLVLRTTSGRKRLVAPAASAAGRCRSRWARRVLVLAGMAGVFLQAARPRAPRTAAARWRSSTSTT
jgi:serine/threonine-protein kinase